MNQILFGINVEDTYCNTEKNNKKRRFFKLFFFFAIFFVFIFIFYYILCLYDLKKKDILSENLADTFNITSIYSNNSNYTISKTDINNNSSKYSIIGKIFIPKINVEYPIISITTDDLLKIAPCRFYGPMPNEIGNLCIAGHNYDNKKFFSNIKLLNNNDSIIIQDIYNNKIEYLIYNIYEVNSSDTSALSQETNGLKEITLITCNNKNGNRIIVKAKETSK